MDTVFPGKSEIATEKMRDSVAAPKADRSLVSAGETALEEAMSETQASDLLQFACDRYRALRGGLYAWRGKMEKWERMSEGDYSDRVSQPNPDRPDLAPDVFRFENGTLGMTDGFVDFAKAQAKNDIFGTRPYLSASPEGRSDRKLAELITKHSQWKLNQSNFETVMLDAIATASWGGTAFPKLRWETSTDSHRKRIDAAWSISQKAFLMGADGDYITDAAGLETIRISMAGTWSGSPASWRKASSPMTTCARI